MELLKENGHTANTGFAKMVVSHSNSYLPPYLLKSKLHQMRLNNDNTSIVKLLMKYIIILLILIHWDFSVAQTKPLKSYISKSLYFAKYLKNKNSFEPFKEVKGGKGLYKFEFYKTYVVLKTTKTTTLTIKKVRVPYQNTTSYFVVDKRGNRFLIEVHSEMYGSTNIDLFDFDEKNINKTLTKCVCKTL